MAEKILQTRILNKIDTLENWSKSTLKIKQGEICLATAAVSAGNNLTEPVVMMKIGTAEEKTFAELPWSFYAKAADVLETAKDADKLTAFINNVIDGADLADNEKFNELAGKVDTLNGDDKTAGSVAKSIKDAIEALKLDETYVAIEDGKSLVADTEIAKLSSVTEGANKVEASENGKIKIDGVDTVVYEHPNKHTIDEVDDLQTALDGKINSVVPGDTSINIDGDEDDCNDLLIYVNIDPASDNALKLNENGLKVEIPEAKVPEYTITKAENSGEYAAVYNLTKDGTIVGASINIPKDIVVKSGSVVDDKIVLVLNDEAATQIEIPVASLIEYVTSGSQTGDMVVVAIDEATHKVTATITDGAITLAKLEKAAQDSLALADSAIQQADIDALKLGTMSKEAAEDYVKKDEAVGYNDILTKTDAATTYQPKGDYATADQGGKADTAVQDVTADADSGLKATRTDNNIAIEIDDTITWVFDCGGSGVS